ncbi:MAG TPA: carboxymuconolactone decarboxylase family protein [Rubricoccaceae bacterium]|nr:carboxymuconolactone decarboxylase family protein [Rubricoccaceae bacterium]
MPPHQDPEPDPDRVEEASEESFPASDPPAWEPLHAGEPGPPKEGEASHASAPLLAPVEEPKTLFQRLAFWVSRRQYGKVLTPLKVVYARKPRLVFLAQHIAHTMEHGLSLDPELNALVSVYVARLNGCAFCQDLHLAQAIQKKIGVERFAQLEQFATSPLFTIKERAALAFVDEAARNRRVSPATFAAARAHFSETEIVELVWLNAAQHYFNLQSSVLGFGSDELVEAARAR